METDNLAKDPLSPEAESPKKSQRKTPQTPSKMKGVSEAEQSRAPKSQYLALSSSQSSANSESEPKPLVGRSGRVRKAKVVFDPSDMEIASKRRSMPTTLEQQTNKSKKPTKPLEPKKEIMAKEKPKEKRITNENSTTLTYTYERRKTIGSTSSMLKNACIVCSRSDTKKGRFVNCVDCAKCGHFTCLRNDRLIKSNEDEKQWQCKSCKLCAICGAYKEKEQLYKCTSCFGSFHLNCAVPQQKNVTKKRFKCGFCVEQHKSNTSADSSNTEQPIKLPAMVNKKMSADGFAGFSQEETTTKSSGSSQKTNNSSALESPACDATAKQVEKLEKIKTNRYSSNSSTVSKSSYLDRENGSPPLFDSQELNIKIERKTPTPDRELDISPSGFVLTPMSNDTAKHDPSKVNKKVAEFSNAIHDYVACGAKAVDDEEIDAIQYDTKTTIRPHGSVPDVKKWDCDEVYTYFLGTTTAEYAHLFKENQIDGDALLLIKREDVLNRFNLKLGPALRLYSHIVSLQYKNNNPILAWNEV